VSHDDTWATAGHDKKPNPQAFVQWKGTDACIDLHCECGFHSHYDGDFAYGLQCPSCQAVWIMPHTFGLIRGELDDVVTQLAWDGGHVPAWGAAE
jgi:hypothetical protein